jgi:Fe-S oxidoreductase
MKARIDMHIAGREAQFLKAAMDAVSSTCNNCRLCMKQCKFLGRFGTPKRIADTLEPDGDDAFDMAFACSLCGLCTAICPEKADPPAFFLALRRAAVAAGKGEYNAHRPLLKYEARGRSALFALHLFPDGCDTVFFPGCTLPGSRPGQTLALIRHLQQGIPALAISLDCCIKPSHDLGRASFFEAAFETLKARFLAAGIRRVITACPNCHQVFKAYGAPLELVSAYELLAEGDMLDPATIPDEISIHDPCAVRYEAALHAAVRRLAEKTGGRLLEMPHSRRLTLCCGEGGAVGHLHPELSMAWTLTRCKQARERQLITYCAGCSGQLAPMMTVSHILDLIFPATAGAPFEMKVYRAPRTYLNRIRLKYYLKRHMV